MLDTLALIRRNGLADLIFARLSRGSGLIHNSQRHLPNLARPSCDLTQRMTETPEYGNSAGQSLGYQLKNELIATGAGSSQPQSQTQRRRRTHKQRFSRSRTGCLTCRGRRIRCDEVPIIRSPLDHAERQTHPTCERCLELELSASPVISPQRLRTDI